MNRDENCVPTDAGKTETVETTRDRRVLTPRADIWETEGEILVMAEMPGIDENTLDVTLENGVLRIFGRTSDPSLEGWTQRYAEFERGDWERSFRVSERVDTDQIAASLKNGVLRLTVPKQKPAQRRIPVHAG